MPQLPAKGIAAVSERNFAIIEAPSRLGLVTHGVETLPGALREAGLKRRLGARVAGNLPPPPYDERREQDTLVLNARAIADYARPIAGVVDEVLDLGEVPIVIGGDCSIMLGPLLALRRRGRHGLLFMDGHADFYQPEAEPKGEAASMELAFATGRGPSVLTDIDGLRPLVRDEDVVVFGRRDAEEADDFGSQRIEDTPIWMIDLAEVRALGLAEASRRAVAHLERTDVEGFWIHLDADVLDDAIVPAVDARIPDGLSWDELVTALRTALASGQALGMDVTILNPKLDPDGAIVEALVDALARGLRT